MSQIVPYYPAVAPMVSAKSRPKKRLKKPNSNPGTTVSVYRGPTRLPKAVSSNDHATFQLNLFGSIASSGTGTITTVFDCVTQATSSADFTNLANLYNEFRVLSMNISVVPINLYNQPTTTVMNSVLSVVDRNSATALTSYADATGYDSVKIHGASKPFTRTVKMDDLDEASWVSRGSSPANANRFYVKLFSSGNSNSINLYDYLDILMVQFRGRK